MDSVDLKLFENDYSIKTDQYGILNIRIRTNQIDFHQFEKLVDTILDSFPSLKLVRLSSNEFLHNNNGINFKNQLNTDNLNVLISQFKRHSVNAEINYFESQGILESNIFNQVNNVIIHQKINSVHKLSCGFWNLNVKVEKLSTIAPNKINQTSGNQSRLVFDSINIELNNCNILELDILNEIKEKTLFSKNASLLTVESKIKCIYISLQDSMKCKELVIKKPIGNMPIFFNRNFKNSIERITIWNPLCLMIPMDIFECYNLKSLNINLLGFNGQLSQLSRLSKLKSLSLYNCYTLSEIQQEELLRCSNLVQLEEITMTFCPSIEFLSKFLDKCKGLKKLNLDPNTLAMLCYQKNGSYIIKQNIQDMFRSFDSLGMVSNFQREICGGLNPPLSCVVQNSIFNECSISQFFETSEIQLVQQYIKNYSVPKKISKYLEIYYCLVEEELTKSNDYDLKLLSIEQFYSKNFKNFHIVHLSD